MTKTLRLDMPQWQGGNEPAYRFGADLLAFLAPEFHGPIERITLNEATSVENEHGIVGRAALLEQARTARAVIERHAPDRVVTLGGDCLVDLAPIAWLNQCHDGNLGVLWIDSHPDIMSSKEFENAHAHVLAMLLGRGDTEFTAEVPRKLDPDRVMIAGMNEWSEVEDGILGDFGLKHTPADALANNSATILDWLRAREIDHLAIHFDLDVLDPATFSPLLFNRPDAPSGMFDDVPQGRMALEQVVRLINDVAGTTDVVGLAITEHLPWDMLRLQNALSNLPLLKGRM